MARDVKKAGDDARLFKGRFARIITTMGVLLLIIGLVWWAVVAISKARATKTAEESRLAAITAETRQEFRNATWSILDRAAGEEFEYVLRSINVRSGAYLPYAFSISRFSTSRGYHIFYDCTFRVQSEKYVCRIEGRTNISNRSGVRTLGEAEFTPSHNGFMGFVRNNGIETPATILTRFR